MDALQKKQMRPEPHLHIVPSIVHQGYRWRTIWNTMHYRPLDEPFHEFLLWVLRWTFGEEWRQEQMALQVNKRHILMTWFESLEEWKKGTRKDENKIPGKDIWGAEPSGEVQAVGQLAYDIYCLQVGNKLPDFLIKKLRNPKEFQGARYEIAVAAIFARSGFEINFLDGRIKSQKHCEFIAKHPESGIEIGVEAKSRPRKGVLHEQGEADEKTFTKAAILSLFDKAREQKPENTPYLIFIDLNLPLTPEVPVNEKWWIKAIAEELERFGKPSPNNKEPYNVLVITNFSYYYAGNAGPSPKGEWGTIIGQFPMDPITHPSVLNDLWENLNRYSVIPAEV